MTNRVDEVEKRRAGHSISVPAAGSDHACDVAEHFGNSEVEPVVASGTRNVLEPVNGNLQVVPGNTSTEDAPVTILPQVSLSLDSAIETPDAPFANVTHGISLCAASVTPIFPVDIDTVDPSKIPSWLCLPLRLFQKHFRGKLEDKILGAFVALEMAWKPVSILNLFIDLKIDFHPIV